MYPNYMRSMTNSIDAPTLPTVFRLVEGLSRKLTNLQRQTMQSAGLTPPQYAALAQLWAQDGLQPKDLAAGNQCTPATMTAIVDALERKDLASRAPHPDDRRSLIVLLTPDGKRLQGTTPTLHEMFRGCCAGLSPDETKELAHLLTKLDTALAGWEPAVQS